MQLSGTRPMELSLTNPSRTPSTLALLLLLAISVLLSFSCDGGAGKTEVGDGLGTISDSFTIGGTVSGLSGSLVLQNNGGDDLTVEADGEITFATALADGADYTVTVLTQPAGQSCTVSDGAGTVSGADVTDAAVACSGDGSGSTFTLGGTVTGLTGTLVLRNSGGDDLSLDADGAFTFATALADGASYVVTVLTQPAGQSCAVANDTGTVSGADVTDVAVTCTVSGGGADAYTIGGTVSGLTGTVVLRNNGGDDLDVTADGAFTFNTALADGAAFAVTVLTQPTGQSCTVTGGTGTGGTGTGGTGTVDGANVTSVVVACTTSQYTIGGTIEGMEGSGLQLQVATGGQILSIAAGSTSFTFSPIDDGSAYDITVTAQPTSPLQFCDVLDGSGTLAGGNASGISIVCLNEVAPVYNMAADWNSYVKRGSCVVVPRAEEVGPYPAAPAAFIVRFG